MIKLSVNETKWSSLLARTGALILYISIWIFDFGPERLPGLSRNGPLRSVCTFNYGPIYPPITSLVLDYLTWKFLPSELSESELQETLFWGNRYFIWIHTFYNTLDSTPLKNVHNAWMFYGLNLYGFKIWISYFLDNDNFCTHNFKSYLAQKLSQKMVVIQWQFLHHSLSQYNFLWKKVFRKSICIIKERIVTQWHQPIAEMY